MQLAPILPILALLVAGSVLAMQGPINAALARGLGDPVVAACVNFLVGFLVLLFINILRGTGPQEGSLTLTPLWAFVGGALGACYIVSLVWAIPQTGALTAAAATIFAQLAVALILDRMGAFGLPVQEITWPRVAGLALVMAGLLLSRM
ncbi:DMT family transporter [Fuscovulum ytuae]|jgi:transporter family-2 protein|uniref:DMT family transporter n=1 Tax=Fuscovulum ytuae TaxID=3042299 RepID=A0ABY8QCR3_9RHOB|nr:DMT family transporter [Fuscovulum sp. YMD61]WGV18055.1 DMT family transporter [Fuscovulum sp. YMD61]